jgi:hypothetical protein
VLAACGLALYTAIAVGAPSPAALKGSYLLAMGVPAALFYARTAERLPRRVRAALFALSGGAVVASALVFTSGLLFAEHMMGVRVWTRIAHALPDSYILETMQRLLPGWL